ncbi:hypothetical protein [Pelosinus sp. IPA-1]|uniref:hypothetical protein n=1 Tax=Pelosinus sp. IPA-1 TaxID=3029569 RepID=UPI0025542960|nr:hypothetical protein [Pelosinus sp. IPA-1]
MMRTNGVEYWYSVTVFIAAKGTPTTTHPSSGGHMWFGLEDYTNGYKIDYYGFASANGLPWGPGTVVTNDNETYQYSAYCIKFPLTKEQYAAINEYVYLTIEHKTSGIIWGNEVFNGYSVFSNSCVDFTWTALRQAGIGKSLNFFLEDGHLVPTWNIPLLKQVHKQWMPAWIAENTSPFYGGVVNDERTKTEYWEHGTGGADDWMPSEEKHTVPIKNVSLVKESYKQWTSEGELNNTSSTYTDVVNNNIDRIKYEKDGIEGNDNWALSKQDETLIMLIPNNLTPIVTSNVEIEQTEPQIQELFSQKMISIVKEKSQGYENDFSKEFLASESIEELNETQKKYFSLHNISQLQQQDEKFTFNQEKFYENYDEKFKSLSRDLGTISNDMFTRSDSLMLQMNKYLLNAFSNKSQDDEDIGTTVAFQSSNGASNTVFVPQYQSKSDSSQVSLQSGVTAQATTVNIVNNLGVTLSAVSNTRWNGKQHVVDVELSA